MVKGLHSSYTVKKEQKEKTEENNRKILRIRRITCKFE